MTDDKNTAETEELRKQLKLQSVIIKCIHTLHIGDDIDMAINEILSIIGDFYSADRAYIFEFDEDTVLMHNTYEWCREGVSSEKELLSDIEISAISRWLPEFRENDEFHIYSVSNETEKDTEEYRLLSIQNIESLMAAPLKTDDNIVGFIAVDNPRENTDTILLIRSAAAFAVNDIYKRLTAEQKILQSLSKIYISMYIINVPENTYRELYSNPRIKNYLTSPRNADEQINEAIEKLVTDEYKKSTVEFFDLSTINERIKDGKSISHEFHANSGHWCRANFIDVSRDSENNIVQVIEAIQYIDKEKQTELEYQRALKKALENQNEIYAEMLQIQGCGLIASDAGGKNIIIINDVALELLEITDTDNYYEVLFGNIIAENKDEIRKDFIDKMDKTGRYSCEFAVRRSDGRVTYVMSDVRTAYLAGGEKVMICSFMDITEKKKLEKELLVLSETDALTGINNRRSGESKIEKLISEGTNGMYCIFDIDKFKSINDNFGHTVGDKALIRTAECLKKSFRSSDVIMRLGGDEFAVFLIGIETEEQGAENINRFFKEMEKTDIPEMGARKISVSLGAVLFKGDETTYENLYAKADKVMYISKNQNGSCFTFSR